MIKNDSMQNKILIIDDSPEAIEVLGNALPKYYRRQFALSGAEALRLLDSGIDLPDLVILDVLMPNMDGYEVCLNLKKDPRLKDIPVIFISSSDETIDKVKAFKMGGVDYITKPFQIEEIVARVDAHLEIAHSRKEIADLYSMTLQGTISAMNDMLAIANPVVSKISNAMRLYAERITKNLAMDSAWDLRLACLLSGIGMLAGGYFETKRHKIEHPRNIVFDANIVNTALSISAKVIENIPKLNPVVEVINSSMLPLSEDYKELRLTNINTEVLKGHILRLLFHYFYRVRQEKNFARVLKQMRNDPDEFYLPELLDILNEIQNEFSAGNIYEVLVDELKPKMILAEDITSIEGRMVLKTGYELSESLIAILQNFGSLKSKKIKILNKAGDIV
jgi:DNA-binding response OmpR family regulator